MSVPVQPKAVRGRGWGARVGCDVVGVDAGLQVAVKWLLLIDADLGS